MLISYKRLVVAILAVSFCLSGSFGYGQSNSASISGTVLDPTGAVVPNATVEIHNPVSHFDRSTTTDSSGKFSFANVPFNPYHLSVTAARGLLLTLRTLKFDPPCLWTLRST